MSYLNKYTRMLKPVDVRNALRIFLQDMGYEIKGSETYGYEIWRNKDIVSDFPARTPEETVMAVMLEDLVINEEKTNKHVC